MRCAKGMFIGVTVLSTSGCMVGPNYVRPEVSVNESWLQAEDPRVHTDEVDRVEWWTVFEDEVLDALVAEAYAQNLTLRQAAVRVVQAMAERGIAVGELFPQTQEATGSFDRSKFSENPAGPFRYGSTWRVGFDAAWELDVWGRFRRGIESTDAALDASLANYDDVMVSLVAEVAATYVEIRTTQVRIEIAISNAKIQEESLQLAESRFRSRRRPAELDVAQAQVRPGADTGRRSRDCVIQMLQAMYQLNFLLLGTASARSAGTRLGEPGLGMPTARVIRGRRRYSGRPAPTPARHSARRAQGGGAVGADRRGGGGPSAGVLHQWLAGLVVRQHRLAVRVRQLGGEHHARIPLADPQLRAHQEQYPRAGRGVPVGNPRLPERGPRRRAGGRERTGRRSSAAQDQIDVSRARASPPRSGRSSFPRSGTSRDLPPSRACSTRRPSSGTCSGIAGDRRRARWPRA